MESITITQVNLHELESIIERSVRKVLSEGNSINKIITDQWFDINEFCSYHPDKPTKATVYSWISLGNVPHHKSSKRLRFLKSEIDEWLKQGRKKTNSEIKAEAESYLNSKNKGGKL